MKATYQKPATDIVMLSTGSLLVDTSNGLLGTDPTAAKFNLGGDFNETSAESGNLSRRSIWDDDEE